MTTDLGLEPFEGAHPAAADSSASPTSEEAVVAPRALADREAARHSAGRVWTPLESDAPAGAGAGERQAVGTLDVIEEVRRAQEGSAQAFACLYDRYVDQVFGFVYHRVGHRQTAEDLVGDVFLRALRRIDTFTWRGADFGAWLITIARNRVNDHFRSARVRLEAPVEEIFDFGTPPGRDDPERAALAQEVAARVHEALSQMRDEHAEVLQLRFIQHLNLAETGAVLGKTEGAVKSLQYRALQSLARLVSDELAELVT